LALIEPEATEVSHFGPLIFGWAADFRDFWGIEGRAGVDPEAGAEDDFVRTLPSFFSPWPGGWGKSVDAGEIVGGDEYFLRVRLSLAWRGTGGEELCYKPQMNWMTVIPVHKCSFAAERFFPYVADEALPRGSRVLL